MLVIRHQAEPLGQGRLMLIELISRGLARIPFRWTFATFASCSGGVPCRRQPLGLSGRAHARLQRARGFIAPSYEAYPGRWGHIKGTEDQQCYNGSGSGMMASDEAWKLENKLNREKVKYEKYRLIWKAVKTAYGNNVLYVMLLESLWMMMLVQKISSTAST